MIKHEYVRIGIGVFLVVWLLMSLAAMAGYSLWWHREKRLYLGKDITQQRIAVFKRAGLPPGILKTINNINQNWPLDVHYEASGDQNIMSYVSYLLIPRTPSKKSDFKIELKDGVVRYKGPMSTSGSTFRLKETPQYKGLLFSVILVLGIAILIRKSLGHASLSWPESIALSLLLLMALVFLSIKLFESANTGFRVASGIGIIGWGYTILSCVKRKYYLKIDIVRKNCFRFFYCLFSNKKLKTILVFSACLILVLSLLWSFLMSVVVVPDDWDAWAIWGSKAKLLALGHGPLIDVTKFGHPDYPLLWPSVWAFSGWCAGGWEEQWSRGWGSVFLLLSAWELFLIIRRRTQSEVAGMLTAAFFLSVPMVPLLASWSYAEAPLWLMMLCGLAFLFRWQESGKKHDVALAGLFCAAAAYTKNEGVLFALLLGCWFAIGSRNRFVSVALFLGVFVVCYGPWIYSTRVVHGLGSHAIAGLNLSVESLKWATKRLPAAVEAIGMMWTDIRQWSIVGWGMGITWVYLLFSPRARNRLELLFPAFMLFAFLIVVLFHTTDITWQVNTSWNRLSVQVFPLFFVTIIPEVWRRLHSA